jgi:hypothetical protein
VPGYDRIVPLGRNTFRAEALIKLALTGFSLGLYFWRNRPEEVAEIVLCNYATKDTFQLSPSVGRFQIRQAICALTVTCCVAPLVGHDKSRRWPCRSRASLCRSSDHDDLRGNPRPDRGPRT